MTWCKPRRELWYILFLGLFILCSAWIWIGPFPHQFRVDEDLPWLDVHVLHHRPEIMPCMLSLSILSRHWAQRGKESASRSPCRYPTGHEQRGGEVAVLNRTLLFPYVFIYEGVGIKAFCINLCGFYYTGEIKIAYTVPLSACWNGAISGLFPQ